MKAKGLISMDTDCMLICVIDNPSNHMNYLDNAEMTDAMLDVVKYGEYVSRDDIESGNASDDVLEAWKVIFDNAIPSVIGNKDDYMGLSVIADADTNTTTYVLIW